MILRLFVEGAEEVWVFYFGWFSAEQEVFHTNFHLKLIAEFVGYWQGELVLNWNHTARLLVIFIVKSLCSGDLVFKTIRNSSGCYKTVSFPNFRLW